MKVRRDWEIQSSIRSGEQVPEGTTEETVTIVLREADTLELEALTDEVATVELALVDEAALELEVELTAPLETEAETELEEALETEAEAELEALELAVAELEAAFEEDADEALELDAAAVLDAGLELAETPAELDAALELEGVPTEAEGEGPVEPGQTSSMLLSCQVVEVEENPDQTRPVMALPLAPENCVNGMVTVWELPVRPVTWV